MFCSACQFHVQKAAEQVHSVEKAEVSLTTRSLEVTFKENADDRAVEKATKADGYCAIAFGR
mgnify:CR=1 FL=1